MAKYRQNLPQLASDFLTDGGLETTLVFQRGLDLPHFAAFPLLDTADGRRELESYYETYLAIATARHAGFVIDTPTWRASKDWAPRLGYDLSGLRRINQESVAFIALLRTRRETANSPCVLNGVIGPRGDGYRGGDMDAAEAEDYHAFQAEIFAASDADMISAITMNTTGEAIGIVRAAKAVAIPCVVSFTVETDGRLVGGKCLREAVETTDEETGGWPAYYMVNCAHPSHFAGVLERGEAWVNRIGGIRANASTKSHAELDQSTELDIGDVIDFGRRYAALKKICPAIRVLGGCCGTDHRHIESVCDSCPPSANVNGSGLRTFAA
jgi:S-methylmethionine-dependent homocysteine/selenocysteine methylase